jgi:hypothetical protein
MNLLRCFAAALLSMSLVGCCCTRCVVSDPCDPCGGTMPSSGGCALTRWWNSHKGYGWDNSCGCTCGGCGCGGGEMYDSFGYVDSPSCAGSCAAPMSPGFPASSGCSCGQPAQYSTMPAMTTPSYYSTAPSGTVPQPIPEVPPSSQTIAPAPPASSPDAQPTTMIPTGNGQPQMVSYEEFQRLPGKVVSGPESTGSIAIPAPVQHVSVNPIQQVSTGSTSYVVPPAPTATSPRTTSKFVRPGPNQQAIWTPSRSN